MKKRNELLKSLDKINGGSDWKDMQFEFYCFWSNNHTSSVPPGHIDTKEENLLRNFGFDLNARFIFHVNYVSYGSMGHENYTVAHIVRNAILDPEYDMEQFREEYTKGSDGYTYCSTFSITINPKTS